MWSGEREMAKLDLTKSMNALLKEYGDEIRDAIEEVLPEVAKQTVTMLKATSPKQTGAYAKDWAVEKWKQSSQYLGATVYNKKHYQLTHLLEYGHAKQNGGRVRAFPHIADAEAFAGDELIRQVTRKVGAIK